MTPATATIGSVGSPPPDVRCWLLEARVALDSVDFAFDFDVAPPADVVVVVRKALGMGLAELGCVVVVTAPPPGEPALAAGVDEGAAAVVGVVDGPEELCDPAGDPPPGAPPPPLLPDATGVTPGQARAKAALGVTEGLVALGLSAPGSWYRQPST